MSYVIVVTPSDPELRGLDGIDKLPEHVRADLLALRDEVCARFPAADAVGETGALSVRPAIEGVSVVIRPEVFTRPLLVNAVMRYAAPRQLLVTSPPQGLVADPRERIDIDTHRRPTTAGALITDHAVRGRPHGTLPWVTRELLGQLVSKLVVEGDRLEMEMDPDRWFRYELLEGMLHMFVADGPDVPLREQVLAADDAGFDCAAESGWSWARCEAGWANSFESRGAAAVGAADDAATAEQDKGPVAA